MPTRRFHYTRRQRIRREHVALDLFREDGGIPRFTLQADLEPYRFPGSASIFVEAQYRTRLTRIQLGTVASPSWPIEEALSGFADATRIVFRLKVVDREHEVGLLLGSAERIRPNREDENPIDRRSLLPIVFDRNLRERPFKVTYEDRPVLSVSTKIPNARSVARRPDFNALVLPSVLHEILTRILVVDRNFDPVEGEWENDWLRFAESLPGVASRPEPDEDTGDNSIHNWIDDVVRAFCRKFRFVSVLSDTWRGE